MYDMGEMDPRIVNKIIVDEGAGCWLWQGARTTCGYPVLARGGNTNIRGNRYVYEWVNGPIPEGMVVRHRCDTPLCVNPDHLELGTPSDNMLDRGDRGRTHSHVPEEEIQNVSYLRELGMTYQEIANQLGTKYKRVEWILAERHRRKRSQTGG